MINTKKNQKMGIIAGLLCLLSLAGCQIVTEEEQIADIGTNNAELGKSISQNISARDGILTFDDHNSFRNTMTLTMEEGISSTAEILNRSFSDTEFMSIYEMSSDVEKSNEQQELIACIPDDFLKLFLNKEGKICIGDTIYQITDKGTLFASKEIFETYSNHSRSATGLDALIESKVEVGQNMYCINNEIFLYAPDNRISTQFYYEDAPYVSNDIDDYNANAARAISPNTSWKEYKISGNPNWYSFERERKYSSSIRYKFSAWNTDYVFYESAGVSLKGEKRQKIGWIKYWTETNLRDIEVGAKVTYKSGMQTKTMFKKKNASRSTKVEKIFSWGIGLNPDGNPFGDNMEVIALEAYGVASYRGKALGIKARF